MNNKNGPSSFQLILPSVRNGGERLHVNRTIYFFLKEFGPPDLSGL